MLQPTSRCTPKRPLVSVILPTQDLPLVQIRAAVRSVVLQSYQNWQLCLTVASYLSPSVKRFLQGISTAYPQQVRLVDSGRATTGAALRTAFRFVKGDFSSVLLPTDILANDALKTIVAHLGKNKSDVVYSDDAYISADGSILYTHAKPDYSPDTLLSCDYFSHCVFWRTKLARTNGGLKTQYPGAELYDLYLRLTEGTKRISHIQEILYFHRLSPTPAGALRQVLADRWESQLHALRAAAKRRRIVAKVVRDRQPGVYRVQRTLTRRPLVSIIVCFRDRAEMLERCLASVLCKSTYGNYEIIGIDNGSRNTTTKTLLQKLQKGDSRIRFYQDHRPFNFSALNNRGVSLSRGKHIVLLNSDAEVINPDWLEALLEHSQRPDVGVVGAKLYYPDGRIQHTGIILGICGLIGYSHRGVRGDHCGYFHRTVITQNVTAVSGACLMCKRQLYIALGGLNARFLPIAFNDVDLCLRFRERGYLNVFTPYSELYHYESYTRGRDSSNRQKRLAKELAYFIRQHKGLLNSGDPYYNPSLPRHRDDFGLAEFQNADATISPPAFKVMY